MEEGGRARVGRLVLFSFAFRGDGGADLGEGGCEVVRGVDEGGAGVTNGDAKKLDSFPISSKGGEYIGGGICRSSQCISDGNRGPRISRLR